jgi:hypothetical protein
MTSPIPSDATAAAATAASAAINSDLAAALAAADTSAARRVQTLSLVHQARLAQLTRTAASVTAQYGASSPQAVAAKAAVTKAQGTVARVAIVSRQMSTPPPQVAAGGWALHGYVYNAQQQPVSAYCVFLVDAQNAYQSAYGFAYTTETGYFQLNFAGDSGTGQDQAPQAAPAAAAPTPQLFVQIANASGQPVFLATTAFQPALGAPTFQNIVLPAGEKPLGDPPPEIRKIAFPPAKKSSAKKSS